MSAAATAAGYLYASGRLRAKKEEAERAEKGEALERKDAAPRRQIKVAVYQPDEQPNPPRRQPKIEYKTRRWKPE
ncbi:MAG: hypothetical protein ACT4P4_03500 [Betaproteobacteria bacterium]